MLVNVSFNNNNINRLKELYLFYQIRSFSASYGGYYREMPLSRNEVERIIPALHKLGWIDKDKKKVLSYRATVKKSLDMTKASNRYWVEMHDNALYTFDAFKSFILSSCESNILRYTYKKIVKASKNKNFKRDWNKSGRHLKAGVLFVDKLKINDLKEFCFEGKVYISTICKVLNISDSTVKRWRKKSAFNTYTLKKSTPDVAFVNDMSKYHFNKELNCMVTNDVFIKSEIKTFYVAW